MTSFHAHSASAAGVGEKDFLCDKSCLALCACDRHECRRLCCPLASLAINVSKRGKRRGVVEYNQGIREEQGGLHECDLVCSRMLSCGNHRCEQRRLPALRRSFFRLAYTYIILINPKLVCFCGRRVNEPPILCGTSIECITHVLAPLRHATTPVSLPLRYRSLPSVSPLNSGRAEKNAEYPLLSGDGLVQYRLRKVRIHWCFTST